MALLRTTALHLYSWRATETNGVRHAHSLAPAAAASSGGSKRAADERHAETLLTRAVEIEPFHAPTIAALAFVLLQRAGGGGGGGGGTDSCRAMVRAEALLEKAVACSGGRGAFPATEQGEVFFRGDLVTCFEEPRRTFVGPLAYFDGNQFSSPILTRVPPAFFDLFCLTQNSCPLSRGSNLQRRATSSGLSHRFEHVKIVGLRRFRSTVVPPSLPPTPASAPAKAVRRRAVVTKKETIRFLSVAWRSFS